ncbi:MAG: FISUMP domain-containing protein [Bacteroidales bacterium]
MKAVTYFVLSLCFYLPANSQGFQWALADKGGNGSSAYGSFTDKNGNTVITGIMYGFCDLGDTALTSTGLDDLFIVRFNSLGLLEKAYNGGGAGNQTGYSITGDISGNLYVAGRMQGESTFGDTTLISSNAVLTGGYDIFLVKFNPDLNPVWARRIGGMHPDSSAYYYDEIRDITIDSLGNILLCGTFYGNSWFGNVNISPAGTSDGFLAKYNPDGELLWVTNTGGPADDAGRAVSSDNNNNVYLLTGFHSLLWNPDTLSSDGYGIAISKFNPQGVPLWSHKIQGLSPEYMNGNDITINKAGKILITGFFSGLIKIGFDTLFSSSESIGSKNIFLACFTDSGSELWGRKFGDDPNNELSFVANDSDDNIYLAYNDPSNSDLSMGLNARVVKTDSNGNTFWVLPFGSPSDQIFQLSGIQTDGLNNLLLSATINDSTFAGDFAVYTNPQTSSLFLCKFLANPVFKQIESITSVTDTASYAVPGESNKIIQKYSIKLQGTGNPIGLKLIILDTTHSTNLQQDILSLAFEYNGKTIHSTVNGSEYFIPCMLEDSGMLSISADISPFATLGDTLLVKWPGLVLLFDTLYQSTGVLGVERPLVVNYCMPRHGLPTTDDLFVEYYRIDAERDDIPVISRQDSTMSNYPHYGYYRNTEGTGSIHIGDTCQLSFDCSDSSCSKAVWLDWNCDGEFNVPGELIWNSTSGSGYFIVPNTASTGRTRIRFISFKQPVLVPLPCMIYNKGETEDYDIRILPHPGRSLSGKIFYHNNDSHGISGAILSLNPQTGSRSAMPGSQVQQTFTDSSGMFCFSKVLSGNYYLDLSPRTPWGGANAIDALKILRHFVELDTISGLPLMAADVNNSQSINAIDALSVVRRFTGLIDTFDIPDWVYQPVQISMNPFTNTASNVEVLCSGDVNHTYLPPPTNIFHCGDTLVDVRDGKKYPTKQYGTQCWFTKNLNVGVMINSYIDTMSHTEATHNGQIEKFCFNNDSNKCELYGGLYNYTEMMNYFTTGNQGICPPGWVVPSWDDWCTLAQYLDQFVKCWRLGEAGYTAGGQMKLPGTEFWDFPNVGATNSSGFSVLGTGVRSEYGYFKLERKQSCFWANEFSWIGSVSWRLSNDESSIGIIITPENYGLSVRCILDQ